MPLPRTIIVSLLLPIFLASALAAAGQTPQPFPTVQPSPRKPKSSDEPLQKLPTDIRWAVSVSALPSAPPSISESHVYVPLKSGVIAAFAIADGAEVWRRDLATDRPIEVSGDRVFVVSGEVVHGLTAATGTPVWNATVGKVTAPILAQDGWVIAPVEGALVALRASDGTQVWRQPTGTQLVRATIEGDRLYAPLTDRLLSLELATGEIRWPLTLRDAPTEVLAFADRVYLGSLDKYFYCVRAATGATDWSWPAGVVLGRPAADATHVYITTIDNMIHAFDRRSGSRRWRKDAPFRPTSGPVVVGSAVVIAGPASELRAFSAKTGVPAGHLALKQALLVPPAFGMSKGEIVMAALTGDLSEQWTLTVMGPPPWTSPAVEPLTVLPGVLVPIGTPGR